MLKISEMEKLVENIDFIELSVCFIEYKHANNLTATHLSLSSVCVLPK